MINNIILNGNNINEYYVLKNNSILFAYNKKNNTYKELIKIENINTEKSIDVKLMFPYICITEKRGLNSSVINLETLKILSFRRDNEHFDSSDYSNAFCIIDDAVHLITQTSWNCLNIINLESEEMITDIDRDNQIYSIDYFHSSITVSKNNKYFLSNGWVWNPIDVIYAFNIENFLKKYETSKIEIFNQYSSGYNWDRPLTFIDNEKFVIAADNKIFCNDKNNKKNNKFEYNQLHFYDLNNIYYDSLYPYKSIDIQLFSLNENNEVKGKLYHYKNNLIALDFSKDLININSFNLENDQLLNIANVNVRDCYFNDKFGIIYYIENNVVKEIFIDDMINKK